MWLFHRMLIDRLHLYRPIWDANRPAAIFLTVVDEISLAQVYPFFVNAHELGIEAREIPLGRYQAGVNPYIGSAVDYVFLQTWFDLTDDAVSALLDKINKDWPKAKIVYLDWFAPADLRYAKVLNDRTAAYVKKQVLRDFSQYNRPVVGDTNLTDFYCRRYRIDLPTTVFDVPASFETKLVLGTGFECSPRILSLLSKKQNTHKTIDVHARVKSKGVHWYERLRDEAHNTVKRDLPGYRLAIDGRVSSRKFNAELFASKMCLSPFGYGEVCWRDYEAMAAGAVVVKPDMSHLKLASEVFTDETYIPLAWDLSDIAKVKSIQDQDLHYMAETAYQKLLEITAAPHVVKTLKPVFTH